MLFEGQALVCQKIDDGFVELTFDSKNNSVNKFDQSTLEELKSVVEILKGDSSIKGLLVTSAKEAFIVGADITEFQGLFSAPKETLIEWIQYANKVFNDLEDLDFPSVSAIDGYALGGGFELVLATTFRLLSPKAKVGLPETKLGLFPGFGGTVRLSRLVGADNAIEWIALGKDQRADDAFKTGAVDAVVASDKLRDAALHMLKRASSGELDWKAKRQERLSPLKLNEVESMMVFEGAKAFIKGQAGPNYPAPVKAVEVIQAGAEKDRDGALAIENEGFAEMAKTAVADSLITIFMNDQLIKKKSKSAKKTGRSVQHAGVLGAGIMGGGIAYQTASKGLPIAMKDINHDALELGLNEATKLLDKLVSRGRMDTKKMATVLNRIQATLSYSAFEATDFVVEAVVERFDVKKAVLAEVEAALPEGAVLSSNTSTISITKLAEGLKRPESFCGVHFFNPVHRMPLVEVIRGEKSSDEAIATAVAYAAAIGKSPLVVNDCPGFLVNRILFPYFSGFTGLIKEGVDFKRIDKVMEKFGWPMGPAYLSDVVGIDTSFHVYQVLAEGYPDRMKSDERTAIDVMYESNRYGQKNKKGFYSYTEDKKGKPKKNSDPETYELLKSVQGEAKEVTDQEIVERMMLPMIMEASRCLEENIVESPQEIDISVVYGLGFPPFRGGLMKYADSIGASELCEMSKRYGHLGKVFEPTEQVKQMAQEQKGFYAQHEEK